MKSERQKSRLPPPAARPYLDVVAQCRRSFARAALVTRAARRMWLMVSVRFAQARPAALYIEHLTLDHPAIAVEHECGESVDFGREKAKEVPRVRMATDVVSR